MPPTLPMPGGDTPATQGEPRYAWWPNETHRARFRAGHRAAPGGGNWRRRADVEWPAREVPAQEVSDAGRRQRYRCGPSYPADENASRGDGQAPAPGHPQGGGPAAQGDVRDLGRGTRRLAQGVPRLRTQERGGLEAVGVFAGRARPALNRLARAGGPARHQRVGRL